MQDNEIITGIRETRHAFAAKYGNDLRKIAEGRCSQTAAAV